MDSVVHACARLDQTRENLIVRAKIHNTPATDSAAATDSNVLYLRAADYTPAAVATTTEGNPATDFTHATDSEPATDLNAAADSTPPADSAPAADPTVATESTPATDPVPVAGPAPAADVEAVTDLTPAANYILATDAAVLLILSLLLILTLPQTQPL